jgi:HPt (histidine-containing phosphotransfer) domain-containing protein
MTQNTIDMAVFGELQDAAGAEFVGELVGTFLEEAPTMLAELRAAQAAGNADGFRRAAHSLKSNSNTFGATRLGEMARDIELGGLITDTGPVDALEAEYRGVATALQGLVNV